MGGKALGIETVRLSKEDFLKLEQDVVGKLSTYFDKVLPTVWYREKESFGDLDVIVPKPYKNDLSKWIHVTFNTTNIKWNGPDASNVVTISFEYQNFQVDLIFIHPDNLEVAHFYYSYNDLNNYVGRVAAQYGMKFGFNGLFYETPEEDILISKNPKEIYTFLGFDYDRYVIGFDKLEETFDYIITSKYFNSDIYQYENLNNINRSRNSKRPNYQKFLDYLVNNNIQGGYTYPSKEEAIDIIEKTFPKANLKWKLLQEENRKLRRSVIKEKFNSQIVKEHLKVADWKTVKSVIDQIYAIPNVDMILVSMSSEKILDLIDASFFKLNDPFKELEIGEKVYYRTNDNRYIECIVKSVPSTDDRNYKLENDMYFYHCKRESVKRIENWYDFKKELIVS